MFVGEERRLINSVWEQMILDHFSDRRNLVIRSLEGWLEHVLVTWPGVEGLGVRTHLAGVRSGACHCHFRLSSQLCVWPQVPWSHGGSNPSSPPPPPPCLHPWCPGGLFQGLLTVRPEDAGWTWAAGEGGEGWPYPPAAPYAHALAYSSHVPGLPSCHCHNYCSHGWGKCVVVGTLWSP